MKYSSFLLGSLLLAGGAISTRALAQDEAPVPVPQTPRTAPAQPVRPRVYDDATSETVSEQVRQALRTAQADIERVQARTPFVYSWNSTPEMAKKTREITVLRQMVALKLSARDLERAIPLLKQLKETDNAVPAKPEQALDEEYNALLRAKPGDPMPPSSAEALRDASKSHREEKQAIWDSMQKAIGKEKTAGIRQMVSSERYTGFNLLSSAAPSVRTETRGRNVIITGPNGQIIERRRAPVTAQPAVPADPAVAPGTPGAPAPPADTAPTTPRRRRSGDTSSSNTAPGATWITPGATAQRVYGSTLDLSNRLNNLFYFNSGQVTLDELIALMEKKLAAMR